MIKTKHMQARMSQRGIRKAMVNLTMEYGIRQNNKTVLNKNGLKELLLEICNITKTAWKMKNDERLIVDMKETTVNSTNSL